MSPIRAERAEIGESGPQYTIRGVRDDMGSDTVMNIIVEEDGDVVLELMDSKTGRSFPIQLCTKSGGGHNPELTQKLRELAEFLYNQQKSK